MISIPRLVLLAIGLGIVLVLVSLVVRRPSKAPTTRWHLPQAAGGFQLLDIAPMKDDRHTSVARYSGSEPRSGGAEIQVWTFTVAPMPPATSDEGRAEAAKWQCEAFKTALDSQKSLGLLESASVVSEGPVTVRLGDTEVPGYQIVAGVTKHGKRLLLMQQLYYVGGYFVKVRCEAPEAVSPDAVKDFAGEVVRAVAEGAAVQR